MKSEDLKIRKSGTTTVGVICKDGLVLAAEKRSVYGYLVASKESQKIFPVEKHLALTISGAGGDALALVRLMRAECKLFGVRTERPITVKGAATLLSNILQSGRWTFLPYMVQLILAGYDEEGPAIYTFDPIGSVERESKFFASGSGAPIALGVLEDKFKDGLSVKDGKDLAVQAVKAATERDIASGGKAIDVATITKEGVVSIESIPLK